MRLPSLRAIKAFSAVAHEGSFARAAAQLGISRSAVSHLISDLERQVGVRLLDRTRGHIEATHDGKALLGGLGDAVLRIEAAIEAIRTDRSSIRLTTVATIASCWLLPRLPRLQAAHPHVQLAISTTTHAVDFSADEVDCGIRHGMGLWPGLESTLLFKETLVLADQREAGCAIPAFFAHHWCEDAAQRYGAVVARERFRWDASATEAGRREPRPGPRGRKRR